MSQVKICPFGDGGTCNIKILICHNSFMLALQFLLPGEVHRFYLVNGQ